MKGQGQDTHFAPAARTGEREIAESNRRLLAERNFLEIIQAMPDLLAILNEHRQIIGANRALIESVGGGNIANVLGLRPGEAIRCRHSTEMEAGCGTSESCRLCGAVAAILSAQKGCADVRECQIARATGEAMDLRVTASPFEYDGRRYTVLTLKDIADENRRQVLERTFFHDILNSAGGMKGIADILSEGASAEDLEEYGPLLASTAAILVHEIQAQRDLLAAEQGRLVIDREPLGGLHVIEDVVGLYRKNPVSEDRAIEIESGAATVEVTTSRPLLMRVLGNMLKNALEASLPGDRVRLGCHAVETGSRFWVWNPGVIPGDVQKQLFKRSFSTKGAGRGIGTYSMMLLGEKYLGGKVGFTSREGEGTTFEIVLP